MKTIIPVSLSDAYRLVPHAQVLKKWGGLEHHELIYFCAPSVEQETREAAKINSARVQVMEMEPKGGWPIGPNQMFSALVLWLGAERNTSHWLFMELDMLPLRGWIAKLEQEYTLKGAPFLGSVVPYGTAESPAPDSLIKYAEGDTMMMGCGIYPANMHIDERIRWAIVNLGKPESFQPKFNGHPLPFDVYLRHPARSIGMANTPLISDQWNTGNYYEDTEGLVCEPLPLDRPHRPRGGLVPNEAVLIHGCKDDSLVKILLEPPSHRSVVGYMLPSPKVVAPVPAPVFKPTTVEHWKDSLITDDDLDDLPVVQPAPQPAAPAKHVLQTAPHPTAKPAAKPKPAPLVVSKSNVTTDAELKAEIDETLKRGVKLTTVQLARQLGITTPLLTSKLAKFGFGLNKLGFVVTADRAVPVKKPKAKKAAKKAAKKKAKGDWV